MVFVFYQLALALFNFVNSRIDAYRILKNKSIAHGINFAAYAVFTGAMCWVAGYDLKDIVYFCITAFFNRQVVFDTFLNLRRGLPYYYQSTANPPKAIMDKIERKLFGMSYDGKKIFVFYSCLFGFFLIVKLASDNF